MPKQKKTLRTIGVEEEYLVVNTSGELPKQDNLNENTFNGLPDDSRLTPEIFTSHIEARTPVCSNFADLKEEVKQNRQKAQALVEKQNLSICSAATVPNYKWEQVNHMDHPRVNELLADFGDTFKSQSIAALHVHTKAESLVDNLTIINGLSWYTWLFLALSGSSRYYNGKDTGISSRRISLIGQTQRTGFPPYYSCEEDYKRELAALELSGWEANKLWYYLRLNPNHETIELRVMDAVPSVDDAVALSALFLCLANAVHKEGVNAPSMNEHDKRVLAQVNLERAMCFGTRTENSAGKPVVFFDDNLQEKSLVEIVGGLVERLMPYADELNCMDELKHVKQIAEQGNTSQKLFRLHTNNFDALTKSIVDQTMKF